ncbi:hypothetical protein FACS189413_03460 [Bacteroidia bacterium]|nr:hypothetical protein FACS189413_03460 [Bacteroidia bacterium]
MIRQIIYITHILTAGFLLLTPVLACHHHHNGLPHFFAPEETHETHENEDCSPCCSHETDADFCRFDQPVDLIKVTYDEFSIPLQAVLTVFIFDFVLPKTEELSTTPYLFLYFDDWTVNSYGLRAPPVA